MSRRKMIEGGDGTWLPRQLPNVKVCMISTANITPQDGKLLENIETPGVYAVSKGGFSSFVYVLPPQDFDFAGQIKDFYDAGFSTAFVHAYITAAMQGFGLIEFSGEAPVIQSLEKFKWV
jgi:hypothetical protein